MRKIALILFLFISSYNWAQVNLVPNYSFEEISGCPYSASLYDTTVINWFQPTIGSSDAYSTCSTILGGRNIPENSFGFQYAQDGDNYSGIFLFAPSNPNYREYIAVRLLDTLKFGVNYCIKIYVSLSDVYPKNISSIGVCFSEDSTYQNITSPLQLTPQFENFNGNFINDTTEWVLIKGNYTATGGEKYIYIGNFKDDTNTDVDSSSLGSGTYVYIDNVQVYECDSLIGVNENNINDKIKLFPNPIGDYLTLEYNLDKTSDIRVSIYDVFGKLVYEYKTKAYGNYSYSVPTISLTPGIYIARIEVNGKSVSEKIIKQ